MHGLLLLVTRIFRLIRVTLMMTIQPWGTSSILDRCCTQAKYNRPITIPPVPLSTPNFLSRFL
ncbi:hypothetical protein GT037_010664 [Alternaria burnsii]|uniref:Uncharacterized protein n=1 Tax=Alternaria burnsii TaxID=1187904 RepID=A0A8H7AXC4_9PLEO|nr:uncharacterized protein GT037_010664 [Alternaria burnsii]KAF7671339.1 hypothetical protein GT037_010664 [Alternaria burnsii]